MHSSLPGSECIPAWQRDGGAAALPEPVQRPGQDPCSLGRAGLWGGGSGAGAVLPRLWAVLGEKAASSVVLLAWPLLAAVSELGMLCPSLRHGDTARLTGSILVTGQLCFPGHC